MKNPSKGIAGNTTLIVLIVVVLVAAAASLLYFTKGKASTDPAHLIVGDWKIEEYKWENTVPMEEKDKEAFIKAAQAQQDIFKEKSHFHFYSDKTYRMDFTGDGGDTGHWEINKDLQMINSSIVYNINDTVKISDFSQDKFSFRLDAPQQVAYITIKRVK